jgi:tRNA1(Val) A37 N6-methylase TrmN6
MNDQTPPSAPQDVTQDRLLDGHVVLRQPRRGYRAGMDAALLAAACDAADGASVLELGCGAGAALLAAATRRPHTSFVGLERDRASAALAGENIGLNRLGERVLVIEGDVGQPFARTGLKTFDAVMANPPFFDDPEALRGPAPARRGAWIADQGLAAWTAFAGKAVREGGSITLIHRADRLADLLGLLGVHSGSFQVRPVQPFADAPAKRVLVRALKTGKAPLVLLPPLVLHPREGAKHTQEVEAILRGLAPLAWS